MKAVNTENINQQIQQKEHDEQKIIDEDEDFHNINSSLNLKKRRVIINDDSE